MNPDKVAAKEKKILYSILAILLVASYVVVNYVESNRNKKAYLLSTEPKEVVCKVVGSWHTRFSGNVFEYFVSGKTYKHHHKNNIQFRKSEYFKGICANSNPEMIEVDLTIPLIINKNNYKDGNAKVLSTNNSTNPNSVTFSYTFNRKKFERSVYVINASIYVVGKIYMIQINKDDPQISYLKDQVALE